MLTYVEHADQLRAAADVLSDAPVVYLDTEFSSNRDGQILSLIQATDGRQIFVIDVLALKSLKPLADAIGRDSCEWVLHAGDQDVDLMTRKLHLAAPPEKMIDTQVLWGFCSAESSVSLAYLKFRLLGVREAKAMQAVDWMRRPLGARMIEYAAGDIDDLPLMRGHLLEKLRGLGREAHIYEVSREKLLPSAGGDDDESSKLTLASFRNAWQLDARGLAALQFLIEWRNGLDEEQKRQVPKPSVLLSIAKVQPHSIQEMRRMLDVPRRWSEKHGEALIKKMKPALERAGSGAAVAIEPPPYESFERIQLDAWMRSARARVCATIQCAPVLAMPDRLIRAMTQTVLDGGRPADAARHFTGWRSAVVAPAYRDFCEKFPFEPVSPASA